MDIIIRNVKDEDLKSVFELSNEDSVREYSINTEKINWEEHINWFKEKKNDSSYLFFIISNLQDDFLGQVRFEINKHSKDEASISISISKQIRGKGFANFIINKACEKAFKEKPELKRIMAHIKPENIPSVKCFAKSGFIFLKEDFLKNKLFNLHILERIN